MVSSIVDAVTAIARHRSIEYFPASSANFGVKPAVSGDSEFS